MTAEVGNDDTRGVFERRPVVVIPAYRQAMAWHEISAFVQGLKILGKHPIHLVAPENLDVSFYEDLAKHCAKNWTVAEFKVQRFDPKFFVNIASYGRMCLSREFYARFSAYNYLLIYQLDAWVFRDELALWGAFDFDFIGAPIFKDFDAATPNSPVVQGVGNGGFSLRRIDSILRVLEKVVADPEVNQKLLSHAGMEDYYLCAMFPEIDSSFRVAPPEVAGNFSFEVNPRHLFALTGGKLPFGCHKFSCYDPVFWRDFIRPDFNENLVRFGFPSLWQ